MLAKREQAGRAAELERLFSRPTRLYASGTVSRQCSRAYGPRALPTAEERVIDEWWPKC
jgi:hypothetical protein